MDNGIAKRFRQFRSASQENPSFFQNLKQKQADDALRQRLEDVLGTLQADVFNRIKADAHANFELAVSQYLDDISIDQAEPPNFEPEEARSSLSPSLPNSSSIEKHSGDSDIGAATETQFVPTDKPSPTRSSSSASQVQGGAPADSSEEDSWQQDRRFLGSLQAEVWCTRSGRELVSFGEKLKIDRVGTGTAPASAASKKDDLIVRFYSSEGLYFARAQESDAKFMSVLIDADVCHFEATVIYADPVLRLGSTVFVQVDCYLKRAAFSTSTAFSVDLKPKKKSIMDETKETREEKLVRLRQIGLTNLLSRLGLIQSSPDMSQTIADANRLAQRRGSPQATPGGSNKESDEDGDDEENELSQDQLEMFYKDAVSAPLNIEGTEIEPGDSFALKLFPYQQRGLAWMLERERIVDDRDESTSETHPLWTELKWPNNDCFWANLNSGELSLTRPTLALKSRGGILADEMGLGKTISTLALIHTAADESRHHSTLIVAPMSLLSQWESETLKAAKTPKCSGCFVYYGNSSSSQLRSSLSEFLSSSSYQHRIVVTTYGMVTSEYKQRNLPKTGGLFDTHFDRIVLDEAHTIKNRSTQAAKACFELKAHRRWALTGTPVVNRLEDLYSLVRFIGIEPWNNFTFWRAFITDQFHKPESRERAMKTVQAIVAPICLRRTKSMRDPQTNAALVELPSKTVAIERITFSEDEKALYSHLYARVRESVQTKVLDGTASSKYSAILALLLRLRQVCCHPLLLRRRDAPAVSCDGDGPNENSGQNKLSDNSSPPPNKRTKIDTSAIGQNDEDLKLDLTADVNTLLDKFTSTPSIEYTAETLKNLLEHPLENEECPICNDNQREPVLTGCLHSACRDCLQSHVDYLKKRGDKALCHICRSPIDSSHLFVVNKDMKRLQPLNQGMQSSKVRALVNALHRARVQGFGKAVVFSQFTSFLDLIEVNLRDAGFSVFRFDGTMSQAQRSLAIEGFRSSKEKHAVLLLSQKAGGVGLNLVVADHAYLMDPWWNFANESQAIDRIHRMGQRNDVSVTRFIIQGSIEERMLKIQEKKHALSSLVTEEERRSDSLENIRLLLDLEDGSSQRITEAT